MHQVGLEKYAVAEDKKDFLEKAILLAKNKKFLQAVRQELRDYLLGYYEQNLCGVVDGFAVAFQQAWKKWVAGEGAAHFKVDAQSIGYQGNFPDWDKYFQ